MSKRRAEYEKNLAEKEKKLRHRLEEKKRAAQKQIQKQNIHGKINNTSALQLLTQRHSKSTNGDEEEKEDDNLLAWFRKQKIVSDGETLRVMSEIGVERSKDLAELDEEDVNAICATLKKIGAKRFRRALINDYLKVEDEDDAN
jgi:hypothetical protein